VTDFLQAFDLVLLLLKRVLFALAVALLVVFAFDWLVRTRRINPFSPVARFFRRSVDPLLQPIEQRVVRAGGLPSAAPWWALAAVVVGGILLLYALEFVRDLILSAAAAGSQGGVGIYHLLVRWVVGLMQLALIVRVLASWFRVSPYKPWVRWSVTLTEWLLRPLRSVIPPLGMVDVTPLVAFFALALVETALYRLV